MGDILFLAHRIPYPPDRGDKIRGYNILKYLARRQRVHIVALVDDLRDVQRKAGLVPVTASRAVFARTKPRWLAGVQALVDYMREFEKSQA